MLKKFLTSLKITDTLLKNAIFEAYSQIFEGMNDLQSLKDYSTIFTTITDGLIYLQSNEGMHNSIHYKCSQSEIDIDAHLIKCPNIVFNFDINTAQNGYNPQYNIIMIDCSNSSDAYIELLNNNDFKSISKLLLQYKAQVIHEINHSNDTKIMPNKYKHFKKHNDNTKKLLDNLYGSIASMLPRFMFDETIKDINEFNCYTEYNSYTLQYIQQSIDNMHNLNHNITFKQFIEPFTTDSHYSYFTTETKKRIIKRLYYVWENLYQLVPNIGDIKLDESKISQQPQINPITEACADVAYKMITGNPLRTELENTVSIHVKSIWKITKLN